MTDTEQRHVERLKMNIVQLEGMNEILSQQKVQLCKDVKRAIDLLHTDDGYDAAMKILYTIAYNK